MKIPFTIILFAIGLALIVYVLLLWLKKINTITVSDIISIISLLFSVSMIVLMLFTILENKESTKKTINAFTREINKQITSYQGASDKHISAIKQSTDDQILQINNMEKTKKINLIRALLYETEVNINFVKDATKEYNNSNKKIPNKLYGIFLVDALNANLINNTIQDKDILASLTRLKVLYLIANQIIQDANTLQAKQQTVKKEILLDGISDIKNESLKIKFKQKYSLLPNTISLRTEKYFHLMRLFGDNEEIIKSIIADIKKYKSSIIDDNKS